MVPSEAKVPRLLRVREAARLTGLEQWRLYDLIKRREGPPCMRVGRTIRISQAALVQWIEERHKAATDEPR
jgi:excisionase family DNA binding protein